MESKNQGFTLIELSIVMVIVGLIIAGAVIGKSLLRSSELRAATAEAASYTQAIASFRDKYQALPGDFSAASSVWGGVTDGDGNGLITVNISNTRLDEQFLAWQHLAKAEMIKGSFTGVAGPAGARDKVIGVNIPESKVPGAGWGLISVTLTDIAGGYSEIPYTAPDIAPNHVLWLGGKSVSGTADSQYPVFDPSEAMKIDSKTDDGLPGSGKIIAQSNGSTGTCSTSATAYNATVTDITCALVFKTGF
jgi:prepilin-type N-terminal cleavage/methylation domain-containing protein